MHRLLMLLTLLLTSGAHAQTTDELKNAWRGCLWAGALKHGHESCHAPSELIPAAYYECKDKQHALERYLGSKYSTPIAEGAFEGIRDGLEPEVRAFILEAQKNRCNK